MNNKSIGIIGGGFVGQILKRYYPDAKIYDINEKFDKADDVLRQDIIFIAINLQDNALSRTNYEIIASYPALCAISKVFIIKSTFVPGTTDRLQQDFPRHFFVNNPEFLTEMTAWEDFTKPQIQILGCPHQCLSLVWDIFSILPDAPIKKVISPLDAEILKHATNSYYASKVIWFNQLYDACKEINGDYETVREIMTKNLWIGNSHSVIMHKGFRGFGGKCLPKDCEAFSKVAKFPLLDKVIELNALLREM